MDRSERRYRTAHKRARRVRNYWEYIGASRGHLFSWKQPDGFWWNRDIQKPWRVSRYYMHEAPGWWINCFMTRPARRKQERYLRRAANGADCDGLNWPDYRRPFVYYW